MDPRPLPMTAPQLGSFRRALLRWYEENRRDLPWRQDCEPYRVWVSEIMLQQTRVAAVLDHYTRFMQRFPTVQLLAAARESSVLAAWSGLGYYHRARRMHQAAKVIVREHHGTFPRTAEKWAELPGVGRYTAAAIASIAFGDAVAVVDGNVERVLQRLFSRPSRRARDAWQQADALLDRNRPGDFNQAMMELGATICTPRAPQCLVCPVNSFCKTRGVEQRRPAQPRKRKQVNYALARNNGSVLLVRRAADASLMAGMWELPILAAGQVNRDLPLLQLRHSITNTDYSVAVFAAPSEGLPSSAGAAQWFSPRQYGRLPLTGLARKILRRVPVASTGALPVSK